jgi:hypothetical protein
MIDKLKEVLNEHLSGLLWCDCDWGRWQLGTMRAEDFHAANEGDVVEELAQKIMKVIESEKFENKFAEEKIITDFSDIIELVQIHLEDAATLKMWLEVHENNKKILGLPYRMVRKWDGIAHHNEYYKMGAK